MHAESPKNLTFVAAFTLHPLDECNDDTSTGTMHPNINIPFSVVAFFALGIEQSPKIDPRYATTLVIERNISCSKIILLENFVNPNNQ